MNRKKSFLEILTLCLTSRCPVCAQGHLFAPVSQVRSWIHLCIPPERCNICGFKFRRESGYYFGVLTPILPILSLATGLIAVGTYYFTMHPEDPSQLLLPGAIGTAIGFVIFFRPAIAFYISLDHTIDPPSKRVNF